jgi:hypothetical protein
MKIDTLIKKRFEELERHYDSLLVGDGWISALSIGVGTSALSLLQKVFGEDSVQFKEFQDQFVLFKTPAIPGKRRPTL